MPCTSCGFENDPGGRFCEACGSPLAATCPACGDTVKPDARFCRNCGSRLGAGAPGGEPLGASTKLSPTTTQPVAERRLVSVLFADLVGFTSLAEDRDPESTRELLTRYFQAAGEAIERHGGTVEKFIGDAVMAVWGTPVAHEDDAERAVRAGLELVEVVAGLAPQLQARAGVLSGEAAVTLGATNQGMVAGDLVNTAARLQGVAEPGTVLVGEPTMRLASAAVVFEEVGEHSLKGKLTPVPAWRAVRVVGTRGGAQRTDALEPPFVGRETELRLLKDQLHATGAERRARLVSITGPGGIGKSRLVWELEKYIDGVREDIYWHRGRSPSYGEGITFWALGEMVRRRAGLTEDDDEETTRSRIRSTVAEFVADHEERAIVEPALLTLLGVGESGTGGRDALFPAWRLFFERISERGTTALVFEDLQWADSGLLDFIEHLLDWSKSRPILVVTLARPELFDKRPDWGVGRRTLTVLALDPLSDDAIRQLLDGLVPGLPASAVATIVRRAEGMPLYAVETVRSLLAEGRIERAGDAYRPVGDIRDLTVPESLRSLIGSRLDALDASDRRLVQDASVLGQVFGASTLAAVLDEAEQELEPRLRALVRREILEVETDPKSPERGQYKFVQALVREVAYGTLSLRDRRNRHLAVARHYEAIGDDELAGALASHYVAAFEASSEGPEADALAGQARIALRAAAERAASLGAHAQAVAHLERALSIARDDSERADLHERAARSAAAAAMPNAEEHARAAVAAREAAGDSAGTYRTTVALAQYLIDFGRIQAATDILERLARDPAGAPHPELEAEMLTALSRVYMRSGREEEGLAPAERALAIAEPRNLVRIVADAMNNRAAMLNTRGRRREARALLEAAVAMAAEGGWTALELRSRNNLGVIMADEDPARALQISREILAVAERIGDVQWYMVATASVGGGAYAEFSDWDGALASVEDALARSEPGAYAWLQLITLKLLFLSARGEDWEALLEQIEAHELADTDRWWVDSAAGEAMLNAGRFDRVSPLIERSIASGLSQANEPQLRGVQVIAALLSNDPVAARRATDLLRAGVFHGRWSQAATSASEGGTLALEGRPSEGRARLVHAIDEFRALSQFIDVARWQLVAASVMPDAPEAHGWIADARSLFERVDARPYLERLDALAIGPRSPRTSVSATTDATAASREPA